MAQTARLRVPQIAADAGIAHIGIDEHHVLALALENVRQGNRTDALAFARSRTREHDTFRHAVAREEGQVRREAKIGFVHFRFRIDDLVQHFLVAALRDGSQQRQTKTRRDFVRVADRLVELIAEPQEADRADEAGNQRQQQVARHARFHEIARRQCSVDDRDIVLAHAGNADFTELLQQRVIELARGINFALEDIVLHAVAALRRKLAAKFIDAGLQALLVLGRLLVSRADGTFGAVRFPRNFLVDLLDLGSKRLHRRIAFLEPAEQLGTAGYKIGTTFAQRLQVLHGFA